MVNVESQHRGDNMPINQKLSITSGKKTIFSFAAALILSFLMAPGAQAAEFQCLNNNESKYNYCKAHGGHYHTTDGKFDNYKWCYCQGKGCTFGLSKIKGEYQKWAFCGNEKEEADTKFNEWLSDRKHHCQCAQDYGSGSGFCGKHGGGRTAILKSGFEDKKWCRVKDEYVCNARQDHHRPDNIHDNWSFCIDDYSMDNDTNKEHWDAQCDHSNPQNYCVKHDAS